jgi:hypothetical protein
VWSEHYGLALTELDLKGQGEGGFWAQGMRRRFLESCHKSH